MATWYNKDKNIDIKTINLSQFFKDVEKELNIKSSVIFLGVKERPYFKAQRTKDFKPSRTIMGTTSVVTTSQIAAAHEFGIRGPRRSFLEKSARRFVKYDFKDLVKKNYKTVEDFTKELAGKLYDTIIECFTSAGWGSWKVLSEKYKKATGREDPPLIDTGQLMSAVYVEYEGYEVDNHFIETFTDGFLNSQYQFDGQDIKGRMSSKRKK